MPNEHKPIGNIISFLFEKIFKFASIFIQKVFKMNNAIIIFTYNRPRHLNQLLLSLEENKISTNKKIYLFCDGPKNKKDLNKINEIKKILKKTKLKISKKYLERKMWDYLKIF